MSTLLLVVPCHIHWDAAITIQSNEAESELPSPRTLDIDHTKFIQKGGGNLKKAKEYNNVI